MQVVVRPINVRGRPLLTADRKASRAFVGTLRMREERNNLLNRAYTQAEIVSPIDGALGMVLPPLIDARVLWLKGKTMRITGMEIVEAYQYYQTWEIEVADV